MIKYDVAIIGGGLAGNLLARQIHLTLPQLEIGLFEKNTATSFKVGESTVEIAADYLVRRLRLSSYLYDRQLPKNGLRFFFDSPQKNIQLHQMSEIGGIAFPYHPGFQLDRARLEADLQKMNRKDGISLHLGTKVENVQLANSPNGHSNHYFLISSETEKQQCCSRWLIDASGRSSVLARNLGLRTPEPRHEMVAAWGRFRGVADWDSIGSDEFQKRVRYTSRMLSTNHFCYSGYWIWFIPLGRGITSIGVVGERHTLQNLRLVSQESFLSFLRSHRAISTFLDTAECIDIGSYRRLAYSTSQYFSGNRWGVTGEAAVFTDPFYSPGSDFIALENDFLTDLVIRDVQGASPEELRQTAELYDRYMGFRCESCMRLYFGLYSTLGSFELFKLKWQFDFSLYYHWWLSQYLQDLHLDEAFLRSQLEERNLVLNTLTNFAELFRKIEHHLKQNNHYHRLNVERFSNSFEGMDFVEQVGLPQRGYEQLKRLTHILNRIRLQGLELLGEKDNRLSQDSLPLSRFTSSRLFH